jgi:hypothetical protein
MPIVTVEKMSETFVMLGIAEILETEEEIAETAGMYETAIETETEIVIVTGISIVVTYATTGIPGKGENRKATRWPKSFEIMT